MQQPVPACLPACWSDPICCPCWQGFPWHTCWLILLFSTGQKQVLQADFLGLHTVTHATYSQPKIEIGGIPNTTGMGRLENFYSESLEFFPEFAFCASMIFTRSCLIPLYMPNGSESSCLALPHAYSFQPGVFASITKLFNASAYTCLIILLQPRQPIRNRNQSTNRNGSANE